MCGTLLLAGCGGSGGSGGGSSTPVDLTPPTVPQGVTASATSATRIVVQWQASTDSGAGVAGYRVFRDGGATAVATLAGTTFTDDGLAPSTRYSYAVRAYDAAVPANESALSAAAAATTPAVAAGAGLDARPDNPACVAGDRPTQAVTLATERAFPNLASFSSPVLMLQAPGDNSRWFVVEQGGTVRVFDNQPAASTTRIYIDISARVRSGGEQGLLGMAFHPGYPADPRVYLSYTSATSGLVSRVSEFRTRDGGSTLDPSSEVILVTVPQPATNHNGGNIVFGPDGLLYIGFGDGGSGGDPWGAIGNGQDLGTLLGKLLRIDVDGSTGGVPYRIPAGNPYLGNALCNTGDGTQSCPEIYAYGLRNPWRWSFDRGSGQLWLADVGQGTIEEVNRIVAGGNYGWRCFEGTRSYNSTCGPNCREQPAARRAVRPHAGPVDHRRLRVSRVGHPGACGALRVRRFRVGTNLAHCRGYCANRDGHRGLRQRPVDRGIRAGWRRRAVHRELRGHALPPAVGCGRRRIGAGPTLGHRLHVAR